MDGEWLTPEEIAEDLKVHRNTVLSWIRSGKIKSSKFGPRLYRVRAEDYEAFKQDASKPETKKPQQ